MPLLQSDKRWAYDRVGDGTSTFRAAGCLVCAVLEAAMALGSTDMTDPRQLNDMGRAAGAFVGSGAIIPKLARCAGLDAGDRVTGTIDGMERQIAEALTLGSATPARKVVLLHVDHDSAKPHGDEAADHFVVGLRIEDDNIVTADPATGRYGRIALATLAGPSGWSDGRVYSVRAFRALSKRGA